MHASRKDLAGEAFGFLEDLFGNPHRVGALALGDRHGHRGIGLKRLDPGGRRPLVFRGGVHRRVGLVAEGKVRVGIGLRRSVFDRGHLLQVDRTAVLKPHHKIRHFRGRRQEVPGLEAAFLIVVDQVARRETDVGTLDRPLHVLEADPAAPDRCWPGSCYAA